MPDSLGSLGRRAATAAAALLILIIAAPATAQLPLAEPPTEAKFLPRLDIKLQAAGLIEDDQRYTWDTHFGGDFDFVDYVRGRMFFLADYQAVLGSEFRPFDPNQGNYTLAAGGSMRAGKTEFMGVLHHVSRHLGDRPKRTAVAWNEVDLKVLRHFAPSGWTSDVRVEVGKVVARADVDYDWTGRYDIWLRRPTNDWAGLFAHSEGLAILVNDYIGRQHQYGGRIEGGVRFSGNGDHGHLELMAGFERVVDADMFERLPVQWFYWGFRLVTQ
jgi:hypothetical protein